MVSVSRRAAPPHRGTARRDEGAPTARAGCPRRRGTPRRRAGGPAGRRPEPGRRRRPGSESPGSACPSSAGGRSASRAGGIRPCPCPKPFCLEPARRRRAIASGPVRRAVPAPGAVQVPAVRGAPRSSSAGSSSRLGRPIDGPDRQAVLPGELEVALVVRRHAHDRAGAVLGQDEVGDPDRDRLARGRVRGARTPVSRPSFSPPSASRSSRDSRRTRSTNSSISAARPERSASVRDGRMLGREGQEGRAVEGVRAAS